VGIDMPNETKSEQTIYRDCASGRFAPKRDALAHPDRTETQRVTRNKWSRSRPAVRWAKD